MVPTNKIIASTLAAVVAISGIGGILVANHTPTDVNAVELSTEPRQEPPARPVLDDDFVLRRDDDQPGNLEARDDDGDDSNDTSNGITSADTSFDSVDSVSSIDSADSSSVSAAAAPAPKPQATKAPAPAPSYSSVSSVSSFSGASSASSDD